MIHFEGVEEFGGPPEAVFAKLSDAGFLAGCLPEAAVSIATPDRAEWKVKPAISFISGTFDTVATVLERTMGTQAKYRLETKAVGSGSTVEAVLNFEPSGAGTKVQWTGDIVTLSGLMKLAPKGLIKSTAEKVIADVWKALKAKITPPGPADPI